MSESLRAYVREVNPNLAMYGTTTTDDNPLSTIQRNAAMKARFDAGMSSCTFLSTVSQRYELGAYAHVDIDLLGYYFDVNALAPNQILAFGILITCEAGFARTESEYGTPVAERLLFVPNRGFWGYFGPERGSLQGGNDRIGRIIHRRQYETPPGAMPPTVGELASETVREAAAFKPDSLLAISYLLVGDPRGRIPSPDYAVVDVRPADPIGRPLTLWPNPTRGELTLSFSLAATASVELSVFDVSGRRVKTVTRSTLPAGSQVARWDGCDQRGQLVESGIYLVQLRVGERLSKQGFVLLH